MSCCHPSRAGGVRVVRARSEKPTVTPTVEPLGGDWSWTIEPTTGATLPTANVVSSSAPEHSRRRSRSRLRAPPHRRHTRVSARQGACPRPLAVHACRSRPHVNVHEYVSGSPSTSLAVACNSSCEPSSPTYGPPALTVGGLFTRTCVVCTLGAAVVVGQRDRDRVQAGLGCTSGHRDRAAAVRLRDHAGRGVTSPQLIEAVCVSCVPASVKVASTWTGPVGNRSVRDAG